MRLLMVCPGRSIENAHLQPWVFFEKVSAELRLRGHTVHTSVSTTHTGLEDTAYDAAIVSIGPGSFHRHRVRGRSVKKHVGVITFPIYNLEELLSPGILALISNLRNTYVHIIGFFTSRLIARFCNRNLDITITESQRNAVRLERRGTAREKIRVVLPGVDAEFLSRYGTVKSNEGRHRSRILFIGSSMPLRGAEDLVRTVRDLEKEDLLPELRVVLRKDFGTERSTTRLRKIARHLRSVSITDEALSKEEIIKEMIDSDIVVFPFKLVPSEMPISPLEAIALGKMVVVPDLDGLGDLHSFGALCYNPGDAEDLKSKIRIASTYDDSHSSTLSHGTPNSWRQSAIEFEKILDTLLSGDEP